MRLHESLLIAASFLPVCAMAQSDPTLPSRADWLTEHLVLIQSELDYLDGKIVRKTIDLKLEKSTPEEAVVLISKASGLTIEVRGKLPKKPWLTEQFRYKSVKEVLTWYAERTSVTYKAEAPDKLVVFPPKESKTRSPG